MVDPRQTLFEMASSVVFSFVHSEVEAGLVRWRRRGAQDTAAPSPSPDQGECPVCTVHRQTAEAYMLMEGLSQRCQREGRIPEGLGGTIPLARSLLDEAEQGATALAVADTRLRNNALTFQGHVAALSRDMRGDLTADEIPALTQRSKQAWESSYDLAETAFRQAKPETAAEAIAHDPLYQWMQRVRTQDMTAEAAMEELRGILEKEPAHA